ncbi:hypothetical protein [Massilia consociata]|uniref:HEAT repeat domain-containing protein n=1 Tax=Massilia consociata TaxID=760117 RepID=A0ABV6FKZ0_9BURK
MNQEERTVAFNYLLKIVEAGGSEESVNELFLADAGHAQLIVKGLSRNNSLRDEAKLAAIWNLSCMKSDSLLLPVFIELMSVADRRIVEKYSE